MNELINQIEELYFLGGNLQEILMVAIEEMESKKKFKKKQIHVPWTREEVKLANKMKKDGYLDKEIAWELGREVRHVRDKRYYMEKKAKAM